MGESGDRLVDYSRQYECDGCVFATFFGAKRNERMESYAGYHASKQYC